MRTQLTAVLCLTVLGIAVAPSFTIAQQESAAPSLTAVHRPSSASVPFAAFAAVRKSTRNREGYSSIKELMESIIDPSADVLWDAVKTVVDQEGVHESVPKTDAEWLEVRHAAVRIIEGGNLLLMPGRAAAPAGSVSEVPGVELEPAQIAALVRKKRKSFDGFARGLRGLGLEALQAIDKKDPMLLSEIGGRMQDQCENCHQTFWYPMGKQ
jgi:hypothetical protein